MTEKTWLMKLSLSRDAALLLLSLILEVLASTWDLPLIREEVGRRIQDKTRPPISAEMVCQCSAFVLQLSTFFGASIRSWWYLWVAR